MLAKVSATGIPRCEGAREHRPRHLGGGDVQPSGLREAPRLDVAEIEEAERILEQEPKAERALGQMGMAGEGRKGVVTTAWATPGTLWTSFFLVAPLVMIVLVSFWTQTVSGFDEVELTLDNYDKLFGDATYWNQLKQSFFNSVIVTA
jgi:hypothetical protein